jgi:hypothetical protein
VAVTACGAVILKKFIARDLLPLQPIIVMQAAQNPSFDLIR